MKKPAAKPAKPMKPVQRARPAAAAQPGPKAQPARPAQPGARQAMKIRQETVNRASTAPGDPNAVWFDPKQVFAPCPPPPGVVPKGSATMAQDSTLALNSEWAAGLLSSMLNEGLGFLGYPYLAQLAQRPEYRRMSEILAKEMTRKWITLQSASGKDNSEKIKRIEDKATELKVQGKFRKAAELDGFFGRAHIYIDLGKTDPTELKTTIGDGKSALSRAKVRKGGLKALRVVEPIWTYPNAYNSIDPLAVDYFKPESWFVQGKLLHASRLLTFVGREVPDLLKPAYSFGGLSLSQMAKPYIDNWLRTRQSVSDLLHSFTVFNLKTNMGSVLQGESGDNLFLRADLFNKMRDNRGLMVTDKDSEEFANVSAPLGGLDHLQAQAQEHMAAVSGIPLVKLLGITPSGLNASSDGEMRSFYDWIEAQQEAHFREPLQRILDFIQLSEFGEIDPDIRFRFNPLWTLDDSALATMRKTQADTDIAYIDAGVLDNMEVRQRLADDEDSPYGNIDMGKEITPPGQEEGMPGMPGDPNAMPGDPNAMPGEEDGLPGAPGDPSLGGAPGDLPPSLEGPDLPPEALQTQLNEVKQ